MKRRSETENGLRSENVLREERVRMEEQRTDASPAPMIPLTIGSDFILLSIWVLRYLNLANWPFHLENLCFLGCVHNVC